MSLPRADRSSESETAFGVARSFSGRKWILRRADDEAVRELVLASGISHALARLLIGRGAEPGELQAILSPTLKRMMPDPLIMMNMETAVARVRRAIEDGEPVALFGDYDVDGSCSAALLHDFLAALGVAPRVYIPDRMTEGYGLSSGALLQLKDEGAALVIAVDCGATAAVPLADARGAGLDVIVLDHHAVDTPPPAFAQVNPNQPGDTSGLGHLCAAGVTFMFVVALNRALRDAGYYNANNIPEPDLRDLLDLVGLATVCDVVPLIGINRAFVRSGLAQFGARRAGLAALAAIAKAAPPYTPYHMGYVFGPRINAGGRVGKCDLGVRLLTARDGSEAGDFALALDNHNRERQAIEKLILEEAMAMAAAQDNAPFLFAAREGWHAGVVGIVAGRLKDRFGKPSFVAGFEGGMARGSARSVAGVDIGAAVRAAKDAGVIDGGGGHAMAAGFSLTAAQSEGFQKFLADHFAHSPIAAGALDLDLDALISTSGATEELVREIAQAGPFGAGNPEPVVVVADARVVFADIVGRDHVRLRIAGGDGGRLDAIAFRVADQPLGKGLLQSRGKPLHVAGRLKLDEWNGRTRVQLHVEDAAPAAV